MITELKYNRIPAAGRDYLTIKCDLCGRIFTDRPKNAYTELMMLSEIGWKFDGHHTGCGCTCPECLNNKSTM